MKSNTLGVVFLIAAVCFVISQDKAEPRWSQSSAVDVDQARAAVAGDFAFSDSTTPANPSPKPGICPDCKGTGKAGDGKIVIDCGTCGGTGKITASDAGPDNSAANITIKDLAKKRPLKRSEVLDAQKKLKSDPLRGLTSLELDAMNMTDGEWSQEYGGCQCGPNCKCSTTPGNPACKCVDCKCDPLETKDKLLAEIETLIAEIDTSIAKQQAPKSEPYEEPRQEPNPVAALGDGKQLLFFETGASDDAFRNYTEIMKLVDVGWRFGDLEKTGHIRFVEISEAPNLVKACGVEKPDTWVLIDGGKPVSKVDQHLTAWQISQLFITGKVQTDPATKKQAARSGRWVKRCGPNGCTWSFE